MSQGTQMKVNGFADVGYMLRKGKMRIESNTDDFGQSLKVE